MGYFEFLTVQYLQYQGGRGRSPFVKDIQKLFILNQKSDFVLTLQFNIFSLQFFLNNF